MADAANKFTSINVDADTRRRAKHLSVVTGRPVYEIASSAIKLLLERHGLSDPPTAQKTVEVE